MKIFSLATLTLLLFTTSSMADNRTKVGLALSGGGARGAAHIGVLRELERLRVPIDYIAGTSMGAIVGAMYASGYSVDDIERVLIETDWDNIFNDKPPRKYATIRQKFDERIFQLDTQIGASKGKIKLPSGLIQGQKLQLLLDKLFLATADILDFESLPIPFSAVATDIRDGSEVVINSGSLSTAVRASMSVPAVFSTVKVGDKILVDGGISNNMPIDVVREMGADVVIAVDISSPFLAAEQLSSALGVTVQLTSILVRRTTEAQISTLKGKDILITPELDDFSSSNFKGASKIIPSGSVAALENAPRLQELSLNAAEYRSRYAGRTGLGATAPFITFIKADNQTSLSDDYILSRIRQNPNEELNFEQLEEDIAIIYGLGIFESVNYLVVEEDGKSGLLIKALPKTWGPNYLQLGVSYSVDVESNSQLEMRLGYTVRPLNDWNAELRGVLSLGYEPGLYGEFNQPLGTDSPYFFNSVISYTDNRFKTFKDGEVVNEIIARKSEINVSLGREFGYSSDFRIGLNRFQSNNEIDIGLDDGSTDDVSGGQVFAEYRFDTLDNLFFPKKGIIGKLEWVGSQTNLGADEDFQQALFDILHTSTFGKHTINLGGRYFSTIEGEASIESNFRLGGLFNLPGFGINELNGQNLYLLRTAYRRPFMKLFNTTPELGITLQYGQVTNDKDDLNLSDGIGAVGVWLGWNTPLGPAYIGAGSSETNDSSFYIILGRPF